MNMWTVRFDTVRPMAVFPRLQMIAAERQTDQRYRHEGRFRSAEKHCLFKYSLAGGGIFRDARGEHAIPAGTGFLCEINDPATAYYYPSDAGGAPWDFVYLCFIGAAATAMTREFVRRYGPLYRLPLSAPTVAGWLAWRKRAGARIALVPAQGGRVVADLFAALDEARAGAAASARGSELVNRALSALGQGTAWRRNAGQWARELGVSREHFTRVFHEETGWTPYAYLLRERMRAACRLLKETDLPIKAIAAQLDYDTVPHFHRAFQRALHMSPLAFRRVGVYPLV